MYILKNTIQGLFVLSLTVLILSACASPSILQNMIVTPQNMGAILASPSFENEIAIVQVEKSKKNNSTFASSIDEKSFQKALGASLKNIGLLATHQPSSKFDLFVIIESFEQPLFGKDFKVTSNVKYKVVEKKTNFTLYDKLISASFVTPQINNGLPVGGMRLANEGAVRENIKMFILSLSKQNPPAIIKADEKKSKQGPLPAIQQLHDLQELLDGGLIKEDDYKIKRDAILDSL